MTRQRLEFDADAVAEAASAYQWYVHRSRSAASRFLDEIDAALERILDDPLRWPRLGPHVRRCLLRRFPYMIIYQVNRERVLILAIAHGRRRRMPAIL
jgi:plasmid stabilization system protein ParE